MNTGSGSVPAPTTAVLAMRLNAVMNRSATDSCTTMRRVQVQRWPVVA